MTVGELRAGPAPGAFREDDVVVCGGRRWAAHLLWQTTDAALATREARRTATLSDGIDLFAVRAGSIHQFCLGTTARGHAKGMGVAAPVFAEMATGTTIGAFNLPDGRWWIVAVTDDTIDEDQILDHEADARALVHERIGKQIDWTKILVPETWGLPESEAPPPLETVFSSPLRRAVRLQPLKDRRTLIAAGVAVVALAGALGGWRWYDTHVLLEAQRLAFERQLAAMAQAESKAQPVRTPLPSVGKPLPSAWLAGCDAALRVLDDTVPGWKPARMLCLGDSGVNAQTEFTRIAGDVTWIVDEATSRRALLQVKDGSSAVMSLFAQLPGGAKRGEEALLQGSAIRDALWQVAAAGRGGLTVAQPPPAPPPPKNDRAGTPPPPPPAWRFILLSALPLDQWGALMDAVPGLTLDSAVRDTPSRTQWKIEGKVYEHVEQPLNPNAGK